MNNHILTCVLRYSLLGLVTSMPLLVYADINPDYTSFVLPAVQNQMQQDRTNFSPPPPKVITTTIDWAAFTQQGYLAADAQVKAQLPIGIPPGTTGGTTNSGVLNPVDIFAPTTP